MKVTFEFDCPEKLKANLQQAAEFVSQLFSEVTVAALETTWQSVSNDWLREAETLEPGQSFERLSRLCMVAELASVVLCELKAGFSPQFHEPQNLIQTRVKKRLSKADRQAESVGPAKEIWLAEASCAEVSAAAKLVADEMLHQVADIPDDKDTSVTHGIWREVLSRVSAKGRAEDAELSSGARTDVEQMYRRMIARLSHNRSKPNTRETEPDHLGGLVRGAPVWIAPWLIGTIIAGPMGAAFGSGLSIAFAWGAARYGIKGRCPYCSALVQTFSWKRVVTCSKCKGRVGTFAGEFCRKAQDDPKG